MNKRPRPTYTNKYSIQTLQEGLEEYYKVNPYITDPRELPPDFAKILLAHDVTHIILGLDTNMYDELKLLPLCFWTSDFNFGDYIRTIRDPSIEQAIGIMYNDLIEQHGVIWLYSSIIVVLPRLLPEVISLWFKTRKTRDKYPFFNYGDLLDSSLIEIRQQFDLLSFITN